MSITTSPAARSDPSDLDERAWRYLDLGEPEEALADELEILRRIRCVEGTPRELPDEIAPTLYELWEGVQQQVLAEYEERLYPASASTRIPSSQSWAIDLLANEGTGLGEHGFAPAPCETQRRLSRCPADRSC